MPTPLSVYRENILQYQETLRKIKKQLLVSSIFRLTVFLVFGVLIYLAAGNTKLLTACILAGIALFLFWSPVTAICNGKSGNWKNSSL